MAKQRVAIIAAASGTRDLFAAYLRDAGFDVHVTDELAIATAFAGVVVIDESGSDTLPATVHARIRSTRTQRVVVVTSRPTALRALAAVYSERLAVLAAPVFGWHIVDALRGPPTTKGTS